MLTKQATFCEDRASTEAVKERPGRESIKSPRCESFSPKAPEKAPQQADASVPPAAAAASSSDAAEEHI